MARLLNVISMFLIPILYFPFPAEPTVKWLLFFVYYEYGCSLCHFLSAKSNTISASCLDFLWKPYIPGLSTRFSSSFFSEPLYSICRSKYTSVPSLVLILTVLSLITAVLCAGFGSTCTTTILFFTVSKSINSRINLSPELQTYKHNCLLIISCTN